MKYLPINIIFIIIAALPLQSYALQKKPINPDSLLQISKNADDTTQLAIYNKLTEHYFFTNFDSCKKYNNLVINSLSSETDSRQKILAYNFYGLLQNDIGFYTEGFYYLFKAALLAEEIKDTFLIARLYNNIGVNYLGMRDNENAKKYLQEALKYKDNKKVRLDPIYNNLGLISQEEGNLEEAHQYYNKALEHSILIKDSAGMTSAIANIGTLYISEKKYDEGLEKLNEALNISRGYGDSVRVASTLINIGFLYIASEKYDLAKQYIDYSINAADTMENAELKSNIYRIFITFYNSTGNKRLSIKYYKLYHYLSDSILSNEKQNQISELMIGYEDILKTKELQILKKEKQLTDDRIIFRNRLIYMLIGAGILILAFCLLIISIRRDQSLKKIFLVRKNIEIVEKQETIEKSLSETNEKTKLDNNINSELKYTHSNLSESQKEQIYILIKKVINEDKIYLKKDLTINKLADKLNISRTYLSQVINERFNKSFNSLINEYRIIEARKKLVKDRNITIEAIAGEVGFGSKSSFNAAFKKYTGVTPSFFIKNKL